MRSESCLRRLMRGDGEPMKRGARVPDNQLVEESVHLAGEDNEKND